MNKIHDKKVKDLMHTLGLNNNLTDEEVRKIVESQFRFTYETIRKLSFEGLTDEEIDELKTNFYYKYIGKIYTNSEVIKRHKRKEEISKEKRENGSTEEFE